MASETTVLDRMEHNTMHTEEIRSLNDRAIVNTYGPRKLAIVRGEGARLWDAEDREYVDFFAGIAVTNLGHCHPTVTEAISRQAATLVHVSNLYYIEPQVQLASILREHTFADRWFFCNSGAEANESAIKIVRRYWHSKGTPKPYIIAANHSFHGRTLTALAATGQPKYHEGFEPLPQGFIHVDYDDIAALEKAITPEVGAIMLEPIQGEGGVRIPSPGYLPAVRTLCDKRGLLLILDEVQTGVGRTGSFFNYTQHGITPDIMTAAKALGNGVPIGAMGCTEEVARGFAPGTHASTFGGNPLCCAAAVATLEEILKPGFIQGAAETGAYFKAKLGALRAKHSIIAEIRAAGLMIGIELTKPVGPILNAMLDNGVICGPAGPTVLRFLPPLIVTQEDVDHVVGVLDSVLGAA